MTPSADRGPASAGPLCRKCRSGLAWIDYISRWVVIGAMAAMTVLVITQVIFRYGFSSAIDWSEEVARLAFVWAMFLAIPHGIRHGVHVGIDALIIFLSPANQERIFRLTAALGAILMGFVFYYAAQVTIYSWPEMMPTVNLTASVYYIAILIAAVHSILHLVLLAWGGPAIWEEGAA